MKKAVKIPRGQLRARTLAVLKRDQEGLCAICGKPIDLTKVGKQSDYTFDHDHETGLLRGVLHRSCNAAEGKVLNAAARWGAKSGAIDAGVEWIRKWLAYHDYHRANPSTFIYPDHKTEEEKLLIAKRKQRESAARRRAAARVKQLKEETK